MSKSLDFEDCVGCLIEASIEAKQRLLRSPDVISMIAKASNVLVDALSKSGKLLAFGNGGSAADAQHIVAEFVGRFLVDRPALPALALSVNTSCVTAIGNDYGFDLVFSRQIEALGRPGDVVLAISTSGNSSNVIHGAMVARKMGLHTIGLTSQTGGALKDAVEHCICVPSDKTPRIQECHILVGHIIAELVERTLFHPQSVVLQEGSCENAEGVVDSAPR